MKRFALKAMFAASVLTSLALVGCNRTVSEETKVDKKANGTTVTDKEKTTQAPDGGTKTTTEHKVDQ